MAEKKASEKLQKTMVFLTPAIARNLELFAFQNSKSKAEVVREALREFLGNREMKPDEMPIGVRIEYAYSK
ncbi:MAG TPA: hypothetical protein VN181_10800 [Thermoanaerobaculia bacterium]|nr:hypothetical protein [Thermoanaerobaculia bacterium]